MVCFFVMRNRLNNGMLATIQSANALIDSLDEDQEIEVGKEDSSNSPASAPRQL
jgi:hypothetical protein